MAIVNNPFIVGGYLSPHYFCDREVETEQLIRNITNGRNVVIISVRRMGKTGLIRHCRMRVKSITIHSSLIFMRQPALGNLYSLWEKRFSRSSNPKE
mgnify:CR=1 FL=1